MSIKAGRVGVNPSQVNPIDGSILSSATSGYTKQEADAKFLTQTDAASTYESKSDATTAYNALQPKTLAVPIEMLSGTKLTVETALQGLNTEKQNTRLSVPIELLSGSVLDVEPALHGIRDTILDPETSAVTDIVEGATVSSDIGNVLTKIGKQVYLRLGLSGVTATALTTQVFKLPAGYRPSTVLFLPVNDNVLRINAEGVVRVTKDVSNAYLQCMTSWLVE